MNKFFLALFGLLSIVSFSAIAEPAWVLKGDLCFPVFTPADGSPPVQLEGNTARGVVVSAGIDTFPGAGISMCQGNHDLVLDYAIAQKGTCFFPNTPFGPLLIEDGRLVLTPSGNFSLFCHARRPDQNQN
jgi:hypothetical protein